MNVSTASSEVQNLADPGGDAGEWLPTIHLSKVDKKPGPKGPGFLMRIGLANCCAPLAQAGRSSLVATFGHTIRPLKKSLRQIEQDQFRIALSADGQCFLLGNAEWSPTHVIFVIIVAE